jgi:hypothetical protein
LNPVPTASVVVPYSGIQPRREGEYEHLSLIGTTAGSGGFLTGISGHWRLIEMDLSLPPGK